MKVWVVTTAYKDDPDGGVYVMRVCLHKEYADSLKEEDKWNRDVEEFEVDET